MDALKRIFTRTCAGFLLVMMAGTPAVADDTELLLVPPPSSDATKPRILFIIDTSTSMNSNENTPIPYNPSTNYGGDCNSDAIYWMLIDGVAPDCGGSPESYIDKDNWNCQAAEMAMNGLGSFNGVLAQYRDGGKDGTGSGPKKWQFLAEGYNSEPVECEQDAGIHGDGVDTTALWAKAGSDIDPWYTADPLEAISWNGAPRNQTYTMYDGNWLNWEANPVVTSNSRIDIVKQVLTVLFSAISGVRVGVERFNDSEGGTIIQGLIDIDTNRAQALAAVASLTPEDHTTIAESLYESALYWHGLPAEFGEEDGDNENFTDHAILVDPLSEHPDQVYIQPELNECAKNFNVLLSDGRAGGNDDKLDGIDGLTPTLPGFTAVTGRIECDPVAGSDQDGLCMDDIAELLFGTDLDPDPGIPGDQNVVTHTVGFNTDTENLRSTAERGGGEYFLADDGPSLAKAFLEIVSVIADRDLSFVAPAVSVNAFNRTQNLNDLYLTVFKPKARVHWPGNLKKYKLVDRIITDATGAAAVDPATGFFKSTAQSFWSTGTDGNEVTLGGAAHALPDPATRNLYTNNSGSDLTAANNQLTPSNAGAFTDADFGLTGSASEPSIDQIIRWARGEDILNEDGDASTTIRYAMGDPLHAKPAAVVYGGTEANPDVVVFNATNDGYLHAIDASNGQELWSFVPKDMLPRFAQLFFDPESKYKSYGIDGNITSIIKDANDDGIVNGSDFVYLIFGLRRGGFEYYALDVTNKTSPQLLWNVTYADMGESWSTPVVTRIDINTAGANADDAVVVLGGGYDTVHDTATYPSSTDDAVGNGIHILDLVSGAELWRASNDAASDLTVAGMTRSIPGQVRVVDMSGDGFADRMYAADLGGQLLRFDIKNGQAPASLATGGVIAQLGAEGQAVQDFTNTRRFYTTPDVSLFQDRTKNQRFISLSIGSGYRAHPLDESAEDRFFSVRDPDVFNQLTQAEYDSYDIVQDGDLVEVSGSVRTVIDATKDGWKFTIPANQKILSDSVTFDDAVTFVGFSPEANNTDGCAPSLGKNFLYRVSVENGDPVVNNLDTLDPADADDERMEELAQGGIAPTPTILFPSPDDPNCTGTDCAVPPIGCVGVECFDPGFANNPVRTLWTQDGIQ